MIIEGRHVARAVAVGVFDGVHLGHQALIAELCSVASARDLMPGVVTFAGHPMAVVAPSRSPRLINTVAQKCSLLTAYGLSFVTVLDFDHRLRALTASQFLAMLRDRYDVALLMVGFNHRFGSDRVGDFCDVKAICQSLGIDVIQATERIVDGVSVSSSSVRDCIADGDISAAVRMLGHPLELWGRVEHGRGIGRTISFPTANISPYMADQLLPRAGVYACMIDLGDEGVYPAMVNIGTNPTVSTTGVVTVESNIIGFEGDIYGRPVRLRFFDRLRDERRFSDLAALASQLETDRQATLSSLNTRCLRATAPSAPPGSMTLRGVWRR